jgi:hypothetical protein
MILYYHKDKSSHIHQALRRVPVPRPRVSNAEELQPDKPPVKQVLIDEVALQEGVAAFGVEVVGVAVPPLLFRRLGFGAPVLGFLVSLAGRARGLVAVDFVSSGGSVVSLSDNGAPLPPTGTESLSLRPVDDKWKLPGWPVIGFSSINSSPYLSKTAADCSASRDSSAVL